MCQKKNLDEITRNKLISPIFIRPLLNRISDRGHNPQDALKGTGIRMQEFLAPEFRLSNFDSCTIIRNALAILGEENPGFELGTRMKLTIRGILSLGLLASDSVKSAIALANAFPELSGHLLNVDFKNGPDKTSVTLISLRGNEDISPFLAEIMFTEMVRIARFASETRLSPDLVEFIHGPPSKNRHRYDAFFDCKVKFHSDSNTIHLSPEFMNARFTSGCRSTYQLVTGLLEKQKGSAPKSESIKYAATRIIRQNLTKPLHTREVARMLHMSERSLRRKLLDAGIGFQSLLDECRANHALERIGSSHISLAELASQTGFSDMRSFRRAFKRWTGKSPAEYRQSALQPKARPDP